MDVLFEKEIWSYFNPTHSPQAGKVEECIYAKYKEQFFNFKLIQPAFLISFLNSVLRFAPKMRVGRRIFDGGLREFSSELSGASKVFCKSFKYAESSAQERNFLIFQTWHMSFIRNIFERQVCYPSIVIQQQDNF